jgi:DnaJ homolog subfamily A member 5
MGSFYGKKIDYANVPSSFFSVLREFFETLAEEEAKAAKMKGLPIVDYPSFGEKEDSYEEVVKPFYADWNGFMTEKTYVWEDRHRYSEAPDRRIRRIMEKENKKFRDDAIKEFNDSVCTLVAFVRKRDPRYKPNFQTDAERQKELREASAAQATRSRAANAERLKGDVPAWTKTRDTEELEESEDDEIVEQFECVACRKTFKSEKQFDEHEKSKKHQKSVHSLKRQMQEDNERLDLGDLGQKSGDFTPMEEEDDEDVTEDTDRESESDEADGAASAIVDLKVDDAMTGSIEALSVDEHASPKIDAAEESASSEDDIDDEYAPRSEVTGRLGALISEPATVSEQDSDVSKPDTKLGKAAQKRAKRAAREAAADQEGVMFKCAKCNSSFPSRTRLFQHISNFGHAAPVTQSRKASGKQKGKK